MIFTLIYNMIFKCLQKIRFNPLIQVNDFYMLPKKTSFQKTKSFNPLIQVNDFYDMQMKLLIIEHLLSFNPLIQVNDFYQKTEENAKAKAKETF